jgi:hypothetical protein
MGVRVVNLPLRTAVAANMRSRQAAFLDQIIDNGAKLFGVAVLRPAMKQDALRVGDRQHAHV